MKSGCANGPIFVRTAMKFIFQFDRPHKKTQILCKTYILEFLKQFWSEGGVGDERDEAVDAFAFDVVRASHCCVFRNRRMLDEGRLDLRVR